MTSLSIAMATFNGAKYIREQMASLFSQTRRPDEIVVCDDVSTDETLEIVRELQISAPIPIRVFRNHANVGYIANFLSAALQCTGDLIQFCDQDDIWATTKIEECLVPLTSSGTMLVFHNAAVFRENEAGRPLYTAPPCVEGVRRGADVQFAPLGFTMTFRRELLAYTDLHFLSHDPNAPSRREAHDQWIFFLANAFGQTVYLDRCLARYRQHQSNTHGWGHRTGLDLLTHNFREAANRQSGIEACARARVRILEAVQGRSPRLEQARKASLMAHAQVAAAAAARVSVYCSPSLTKRVASFAHLASTTFRSDDLMRQVGLRGLIKDALIGPLFGGMLSRGPGRVGQSHF